MTHHNEDALAVAQVLGNKLRPVYTFAAVMLAMVGGGATYVWQLADFINRDAVHEKQQDDNQLAMQKRLNEHDDDIKAARERNLKVVELLINDLALLRHVQLQTLPARKRAEISKQFEAQRIQGISLLVEAQK